MTMTKSQIFRGREARTSSRFAITLPQAKTRRHGAVWIPTTPRHRDMRHLAAVPVLPAQTPHGPGGPVPPEIQHVDLRGEPYLFLPRCAACLSSRAPFVTTLPRREANPGHTTSPAASVGGGTKRLERPVSPLLLPGPAAVHTNDPGTQPRRNPPVTGRPGHPHRPRPSAHAQTPRTAGTAPPAPLRVLGTSAQQDPPAAAAALCPAWHEGSTAEDPLPSAPPGPGPSASSGLRLHSSSRRCWTGRRWPKTRG